MFKNEKQYLMWLKAFLRINGKFFALIENISINIIHNICFNDSWMIHL